MSYAHYWQRKVTGNTQAEWDNLIVIAADIFAASSIAVTGDYQGKTLTPIVLNDDRIVFNGYPYEAADDVFIFTRTPAHRAFIPAEQTQYIDCCRTSHKPYDTIVTALLIAAVRTFGDMRIISSDGDHDGWRAGARLYLTAQHTAQQHNIEYLIDSILDHPQLNLA